MASGRWALHAVLEPWLDGLRNTLQRGAFTSRLAGGRLVVGVKRFWPHAGDLPAGFIGRAVMA